MSLHTRQSAQTSGASVSRQQQARLFGFSCTLLNRVVSCTPQCLLSLRTAIHVRVGKGWTMRRTRTGPAVPQRRWVVSATLQTGTVATPPSPHLAEPQSSSPLDSVDQGCCLYTPHHHIPSPGIGRRALGEHPSNLGKHSI